MDDPLLERFLQGDPLPVRQLRPIVLDYVGRTGGKPDDAREVFQIVSLALFERSRRTPEQYLSKVFRTWLNRRHRKDPAYVAGQVSRLEVALLLEFAAYPDLKTGLRMKDAAAVDDYRRSGQAALLPFLQAEAAGEAVSDELLDKGLEKIQHTILDFTDYFLKSCKNEWLRLKKYQGLLSPEEELTHLAADDQEESEGIGLKNLVLNLLQKASALCKNLLHQHLIEEKTKEELLETLGYTNPDSFDVAKSRCLNALRLQVKKKLFKPADA